MHWLHFATHAAQTGVVNTIAKKVVESHDLPTLAVEEDPRVVTPWESLIGDGVQPALILGAERRTAGPRKP